MTSPIEAMAKAIGSTDLSKPGWADVAARAALLALADCEIPADIPARAWSMHEANIPEGVVVDVNAMMVAEFRAMLRSIATGR